MTHWLGMRNASLRMCTLWVLVVLLSNPSDHRLHSFCICSELGGMEPWGHSFYRRSRTRLDCPGPAEAMVAAGNRVVFSPEGSYVEDVSSGEVVWLKEQGGMYMLKVWVKTGF